MIKAIIDGLWAILSHPQSLVAGLVLGYLCPGSISQAITWIKSKV